MTETGVKINFDSMKQEVWIERGRMYVNFGELSCVALTDDVVTFYSPVQCAYCRPSQTETIHVDLAFWLVMW